MPLTMWFEAAYHVATYTPGIFALQLQKHLGTSYETAFNMLHKLRAAMVRPERDRIHGEIEMDETFVGSHKPGKRGRGAEGKTIVLGAIEVLPAREKRRRSGRLRMRVVPDVKGKTIVAFAKESVEPGSPILSDDLSPYKAQLPPSCRFVGQSGPHSYVLRKLQDLDCGYAPWGQLKAHAGLRERIRFPS